MNENKYDFFADRTEEKLRKAAQVNLAKKEKKEKMKQQLTKISKYVMKGIGIILLGVAVYSGGAWFVSSVKESKIAKQQAIINEAYNSVKGTQKLWGDLYDPTNEMLNKYQIKTLKVEKTTEYYKVDIFMDNGVKLERAYPFFQKPDIQGFKDIKYSYQLEKRRMPDGKNMMISWGIEKIWDAKKADKKTTEQYFIPEVNYLIKRSAQSNMWGQIQNYRKASYSKSELKNYMDNSPSWLKEDSSEMLSFIIDQINIPESFYQNDKINTFMMAEMLQGYGAKVDKNQVCNAYQKLSESDKGAKSEDNKLFTLLLDGKEVKETC